MTKRKKQIYEPKPLFVERMKKLLSDEKDFSDYWEISKTEPVDSIRCNTLKISPKELKEKLESSGWKISQPWKDFPEVMIVLGKNPTGDENEIFVDENTVKLFPGELGRKLEHLLGYYYVQELSSLLPVIALKPKEGEIYLDICAAPGSKTTQAASFMKNKGTIIANEVSMGRMRILASNLEKCGVTNTIITRHEGQALCRKFEKSRFEFDKILVDAPCSGEGTIRSSPKTFLMWNPKTIKFLSKLQKELFRESFKRLKVGGEMIYSTCTHAPEENEEIVDAMLKEFSDSIEIVPLSLPVKTRSGIVEWEGKKYDERVKLSERLYPQDNNTEGFFVSKFRRIK